MDSTKRWGAYSWVNISTCLFQVSPITQLDQPYCDLNSATNMNMEKLQVYLYSGNPPSTGQDVQERQKCASSLQQVRLRSRERSVWSKQLVHEKIPYCRRLLDMERDLNLAGLKPTAG